MNAITKMVTTEKEEKEVEPAEIMKETDDEELDGSLEDDAEPEPPKEPKMEEVTRTE